MGDRGRRWSEADRALGMDRAIARRDFLQGVAVAGVGLVAGRRAWSGESGPQRSPAHGPFGLRGQDPDAMRLGHRLRDQASSPLPSEVHDTGERYDLVVVGTGLAGLTAAYVYHRERHGRCRILLLDNDSEIGGHARRNTFEADGQTLIAQGGTFALEEPDHSPPEAARILTELGIDAARLEGYRDPDFKKRFGLSQGVFFDPRLYPEARAAWVSGFYDVPYERFFAQAPIPEASRRELVELYTTRCDYLAGTRDREAALAATSWEAFVREQMGLGDEAVRFCDLYATDLVGLGCDAVSALAGFEVGPGFAGMGGEGFVEQGGILRYAYEPTARFPDGNHTLARCLLRRLVPGAVSGDGTPEGCFESALTPAAFDRADSDVRVRLRTLAVDVRHDGPLDTAAGVRVDYVDAEGRRHRVRAGSAIVTAWGMAARHAVPELGEAQREALGQYRYAACLYVNVLLRHWRFAAQAGVFDMFFPGGWSTWGHIADPLSVGGYRPDYHPDRPTVLSLYKYLHTRGVSPEDQMVAARIEMEQTPFEDYERTLRHELEVMFGPWGFDPAEDVLGITVNRWGHGYCFFSQPGPLPPEGRAAFERGRVRLGRISFAGADAAGTPWTQAAMVQAHRAAFEQLG